MSAKSIGLAITLADITEEEFRVLEPIKAERQEQRSKRCLYFLTIRPNTLPPPFLPLHVPAYWPR
jgi:hypothetical protein